MSCEKPGLPLMQGAPKLRPGDRRLPAWNDKTFVEFGKDHPVVAESLRQQRRIGQQGLVFGLLCAVGGFVAVGRTVASMPWRAGLAAATGVLGTAVYVQVVGRNHSAAKDVNTFLAWWSKANPDTPVAKGE